MFRYNATPFAQAFGGSLRNQPAPILELKITETRHIYQVYQESSRGAVSASPGPRYQGFYSTQVEFSKEHIYIANTPLDFLLDCDENTQRLSWVILALLKEHNGNQDVDVKKLSTAFEILQKDEVEFWSKIKTFFETGEELPAAFFIALGFFSMGKDNALANKLFIYTLKKGVSQEELQAINACQGEMGFFELFKHKNNFSPMLQNNLSLIENLARIYYEKLNSSKEMSERSAKGQVVIKFDSRVESWRQAYEQSALSNTERDKKLMELEDSAKLQKFKEIEGYTYQVRPIKEQAKDAVDMVRHHYYQSVEGGEEKEEKEEKAEEQRLPNWLIQKIYGPNSESIFQNKILGWANEINSAVDDRSIDIKSALEQASKNIKKWFDNSLYEKKVGTPGESFFHASQFCHLMCIQNSTVIKNEGRTGFLFQIAYSSQEKFLKESAEIIKKIKDPILDLSSKMDNLKDISSRLRLLNDEVQLKRVNDFIASGSDLIDRFSKVENGIDIYRRQPTHDRSFSEVHECILSQAEILKSLQELRGEVIVKNYGKERVKLKDDLEALLKLSSDFSQFPKDPTTKLNPRFSTENLQRMPFFRRHAGKILFGAAIAAGIAALLVFTGGAGLALLPLVKGMIVAGSAVAGMLGGMGAGSLIDRIDSCSSGESDKFNKAEDNNLPAQQYSTTARLGADFLSHPGSLSHPLPSQFISEEKKAIAGIPSAPEFPPPSANQNEPVSPSSANNLFRP